MKSEKTIKKLEAEITELKRMENALQESEEAYRSLFENNSVAIAIFETDTTISMVNEKYCELSGYSKQEVIGMKWTEQLPPAELERLKEFNRIRLIDSKNAPREYEFQFLRKDGEMRFATISIVMLNQKIVASFVDITERRRTEKALKESEEKFLQAFQTAPYAITITCPETEKFLEINESFLTISGYSREDLSTQSSISLQMWVKEADRENVVLTLKEGREVIKKEIFFRRKNGNVFLGSFSAKIIKIMEKPYVLSSINDVSERELTKARLQESEEKYRRLVNNSHDIIYTLTAEGILNFVSPSWTELLGHPVEEVMGQSFQKFVHPEDLSKCVEFLKKVIATGQKQSDAEYRVKHISGEWRWHTTNAVPKHNEAGKIIGFYGIARDITENKQMGKALIESERLKVIGELSSGVAHDFNNILQVIFGNVELGLLLPDAPKEALKYFKAIKEATTDGASRVRQLQRFTSKERTNDRQALDLCALLEEIVLQTKPLWKDEAEKKGLKISFQKNYGETELVDGEPGEIRTVFYNLLKNAVEAMPKGGKITLETGVHEEEAVSYVRVTDTGIGMDEETKKRIFDPFFSTKGFEPGRGLGMNAVYTIVRDHEGKIVVTETAVGRGTTIEIKIPFGKKPVKNSVNKSPNEQEVSAKILWVDDEEMVRTLGKELLTRLGHSVEVAASGEEALALLEKNQHSSYDLIITDVGMPRMSGLQLAEAVKERCYVGLKVAVVTGWGDNLSVEEKRKCGIGYVLGKPVSMMDLKNLVREALQSKI